MLASLSLLFFAFLGSSCVNEEYDMSGDNLNLEVTPFQEGVTIPLGSTEQIKLKELLKDVDEDILKAAENGAYSISMGDSFDMSEELAELKELIEIPDVEISEQFNFDMKNVDVSDIEIKAQKLDYKYNLPTLESAPEVRIPSVSEKIEFAAGLDKFRPDESMFELGLPAVSEPWEFMTINKLPDFVVNNNPIDVDMSLVKDVNIVSDGISFSISLPEGVNSVDEIILDEDAGIKVSVQLPAEIFLEGSIIPDINVNLSELLHLEGGDVVNLANDFVLSKGNGYKNSKTYNIKSLAVASSDWKKDGKNLKLDKSAGVSINGKFVSDGLKTTTALLNNAENVKALFEIEFVDVRIKDVVMDVEPVEISMNETVSMAVDNIELPEGIESIENIMFTSASGVDIVLKAQNLDRMKGLEAGLETLAITFPRELQVDGADADNKVVISNVDLSKGVTKHVAILGVDLPEPKNGKISFNGEIKVEALASAGGKVHSAGLPAAAADDVKVSVEVKSNLEVADYQVNVSGLEYKVDTDVAEIKIEVSKEIADLKQIVVYPERTNGNYSNISVDFYFPEIGLDIVPAAEGLRIWFPEMVKFSQPEFIKEFNYDPNTHTATLYDEFGVNNSIWFAVDRLVLTPVLDPADGKYYVSGKLRVDGGVALAPGVLTKAQIEKLADPNVVNTIEISGWIPEFKPKEFEMETYQTAISEELEFDFISGDDLPAELVSLDVVELNETYVNLSMYAPTLSELGYAKITVDVDVDLPDMIKVAGADANGSVKLTGTFKNNRLELEPMKIEALDFAGSDIREGLKGAVKIDGTVRLDDIKLDVQELLDKGIDVSFKVAIKDIDIAKVSGRVDYQVEPVVETVDLSDITDLLGDSGAEATLDFNHANLALEILTNLDVTVKAQAKLIPYYNGEAQEKDAVEVNLLLRPDEDGVVRFWLADKDSDRRPAGYDFVQADILKLIREIPEKLDIQLSAGTDPDATCVLEPNEDYTLKVNYKFELPLEFGKDFNVTYRTQIEDIPEIVGSLLSKGNKVKLAGKISNSLPLGLDLRLNFLDSDGEIIDAATGCGTQTIAPCGLDGSAVDTELNVVVGLENGARADDIKSLELVFNASSAGVIGVPVKEESYLQAVLQLVLPEGITVDLNDFLNGDEQ